MTATTAITAATGGTSAIDTSDEWIELYNTGIGAVELSNWLLDDGDGGSAPYPVPQGTFLEPGAFLLFFGQTTGLVLDDTGDRVRLIDPSGAIVDSVAFGALLPGSSYSRDESGVWHDDWATSPGGPNGPATMEELGFAVPPPTLTPIDNTKALEKRDSLKREAAAPKR